MRTALESVTAMERGAKLYNADLRAHQIVDMCVANALNESGEPNEHNYRRWAADVAALATTTLLRYIYDSDGEINWLSVERDHYKRIAEELSRLTPTPLVIASITGRDQNG